MRVSLPSTPAYDVALHGQPYTDGSESRLARRKIALDSNWSFRKSSADHATALPVSRFPTKIHLDLYQHGLIPDPFHAKNERDLQWIGEESWTYQTTFPTPRDILRHTTLCFDGLDTYAKVILNETEIFRNESMFVPARLNMTKLLRPQGLQNDLRIQFDSAWLRGLEIMKQHPNHAWGCSNGHPSRLAVRKAQYHYGWDWGPKFMTCGPWRPVYLETFYERISELRVTYKITEDLRSATVKITLSVEDIADVGDEVVKDHQPPILHRMLMTIRDASGSIIAHAPFCTSSPTVSVAIPVTSPELWYPARYGGQPLYRISASLMSYDGRIVYDQVDKVIGFRTVELAERDIENGAGKSFYFRVNNIPIFCGGTCWIPADSFLPKLTSEDYYEWIRMAVDGNQSMIRVWGGGVYEDDKFYEACDELGILVWQDFMMACGAYPAYAEFLSSMEAEAEANVGRLMHHPSIIVWAGNNEDYQYQEQNGLEYDPDDKDPDSWLRSTFPARYIYEKLLPDILHNLIDGVIYRFGSPFGGKTSNDPTVGDLHQWNVWHGEQRPYQDWASLSGRFVSEFGMQALPNVRTIEAFMDGINSDEWHPYSSTMDFHNKAFGQTRRMAMYMAENLRFELQPLSRYVYLTQLMQAECLGSAIRAFKRNWGSDSGWRCGGALAWQLNDCWPCASWSVVDHFRRPKMAYWAIKRELAPLTIGMQRSPVNIEGIAVAASDPKHQITIWATNSGLSDEVSNFVVKEFNISTGVCLDMQVFCNHRLPANTSRVFIQYSPGYVDRSHSHSDRHLNTVVAAYLHRRPKQPRRISTKSCPAPLARFISWPEPLKYMPAPTVASNILVEIQREAEEIYLSANLPIKGVLLSIKRGQAEEVHNVKWADNGVDLVPDDRVLIKAPGIRHVKTEDLILDWYDNSMDIRKDDGFTVREI